MNTSQKESAAVVLSCVAASLACCGRFAGPLAVQTQMTSEARNESTDGFGQDPRDAEAFNNLGFRDTPAPPARKFHRARSSLRMDPEEAAGLELENRHLRRRV
eukprot:s7981_g1.t1